jgi:hypothetical protein
VSIDIRSNPPARKKERKRATKNASSSPTRDEKREAFVVPPLFRLSAHIFNCDRRIPQLPDTSKHSETKNARKLLADILS